MSMDLQGRCSIRSYGQAFCNAQILDKLKNKVLPESKAMIAKASDDGSTYTASLAKAQIPLNPAPCLYDGTACQAWYP
jgi:hypothetical protein